ncbi:unnamed protein product [Xyrichtys novacula]|uniref:Unnamed protein product n=1 Tax=Xyrichtys novacula TaxID=13765 RepID=A0AAV1GP31_XYRNO|nr:unnamed protein product [Xyrichtys novacula]
MNQGIRVVLDVTEGLRDCSVTCDNFFTSYELGQQLLKRKMTMELLLGLFLPKGRAAITSNTAEATGRSSSGNIGYKLLLFDNLTFIVVFHLFTLDFQLNMLNRFSLKSEVKLLNRSKDRRKVLDFICIIYRKNSSECLPLHLTS